ncbi:MAG: hypothetical protein IJ419_12890, partial [Agathobacter sp.]|nr:hypothetical protein [Agathobacter sp.]
MKKYWKRILSMMLIAALLIQILPATAKGEEITILDEDLECEPQTGLADMYEYLTYDAGKAGMVQVNTYTGEPHVRRTDISLGGERMPVEIEFYFDPENQFYKNPYGVGWTTSYNQWITYNSDTSQYQYKNENGTYIYFSNSGEVTEDGYEIWTEVTTYGIGETGIELYRLAGAGLTNCTAVKLINIDKTYTFDGYGRLSKISDGINEITITYISASTDAIKYITDPAGRRYYFTYESGYLKTIDVRIENSIALPNTAVTYVMQSGVLTAVSYGTEDSVGYGYDSNWRLTSIKNIDGCGYEFHYAYNDLARWDVVTGIIQKAAIGTSEEEAGTEVSIAYPADGITVITDDSTRNIYKFDGCGRVTSCELKHFVSGTTYETVYGYNMTYDYVTNEDGTITNSLVDVEYYDADGVIEEAEDELEEAESEEFTEEIESSEESGILEEGETAGEETETTEEVIEDYITTTDEYGNILTETHIVGELQQVKKYEYIYNGDMLSSVTDVNGTTVKYTYGAPYSQITGITDGNGNKTSYTYNALGELTSAKMNVSGLKTLLSDRTITDSSDEIKAEYVYKQGRLTEIHYGDCVYAFTYDKWGNILRAAMNEKILVRYDYGDAAYKGLVQSAVYSTGQSVYYTYNSLGQVSTVGYAQGNVSFIYTYDSDGTLTKIFDKDYNITTEFTDDGYTIYKGTSENVLYFYNGTEEEYIENVLGKVLSFEIENDGSITIQNVMNEVTGANLYSEQTAYDAFERLDEKILSAGSLNITQSYDYVTNGNITGDRVSDYGISYNQGEDTNNLHFTYTYDGNGNITSVEKTEETADGAVTYKTEYTYDEAGQLKTAYDEELGIRYSYVYDAYGN